MTTTQPSTIPENASGLASPRRPEQGKTDVTPMMAQYHAIKRGHPDCLLFYRMGDFYELFFEDAVKAAKALDITLTRRGKHQGSDIPMCGVPVHAADGYLSRLIRKGFRVAVCEQTEDPAEARKRGGKALVTREVVRIVTRGTITEEALLDSRRHNYLAALADSGGALGLAWLDVSTGEFCVQPTDDAHLPAALARLDPGELLVPERLLQRTELFEMLGEWKSALTPQPSSRFDSEAARRRLEVLYGVRALDGFGSFERAELAACGGLVEYVELTQTGKLPRLSPPRRLIVGAALEVDPATRRNLELVQTLSGDREGSLLSAIDRTVTGAGGRFLASHLAAPLTDPAEIMARLDMVQFFVEYEGLRDKVREVLGRCPDIERALSRITLGRGGPRDLDAVGDGLDVTQDVIARLSEDGRARPPAGIAACVSDLGSHSDLIEKLRHALKPDLPMLTRDGGFIAEGFAPQLDQLRTLRDDSRRLIANLQNRYVSETGIGSLKIRHNNVLGYFVEVTNAYADKMPTSDGASEFTHRQTMANAVRYNTVELGELENRISRAADQAVALEVELFDELAGEIERRAESVALAARGLAALDVASALAYLAVTRRYNRPVVDSSFSFSIVGGRHPVVEAALESSHELPFVPNDCDLAAERRLWLVTGPNMAGKSTFLRQNALIVLMAQMGSFVPALSAQIGVVDRLFSRVGAGDDLARGRSTFMVEMVETAAILNQASERSLVILDEIGRGTATYDGLSIAWATLEHLHDVNRCRAMFATHFHELTALGAKLEALNCNTMRVKEWQGEVIFLHEVVLGAADRSYGIHVARLAGLPPAVIARAEEVLGSLELSEQSGVVSRLADDLPLFSTTLPDRGRLYGSSLEDAFIEIDPDTLTPRTALELIYRLKDLTRP